jgi:hypothetical protein
MSVIETVVRTLNARRLEKVAALRWYENLEQTCADWGFLTVSDGLKSMAWDELRHSELLTSMVGTLEGRHGDAQPVRALSRQPRQQNQSSQQIQPTGELVVLALEIADGPPVDWMFWSEPEPESAAKSGATSGTRSSTTESRRSKGTKRESSKSGSRHGEQQMNDETMNGIAGGIREDMLVHASGSGSDTLIGKVVGIKKHAYIKLGKRAAADGERRYLPLEWVASVTDGVVYLNRDTRAVRLGWLDKAAIKRRRRASRISNASVGKNGASNAADD